MYKFICISTEKMCNLILALFGIEGEYDGFINDGKLKRLCFIVKKDFERIDFSKFAELHDLGIEGEFGKEDDEISGFIDVRLDSQENFLGETLFEVPEDKIVALIKMLISERFVSQTDDIVDVRINDTDSVVVDLKSDSSTGISLLDDDLRIIAMIGFFMTVYVLSDNMLRIKLTF